MLPGERSITVFCCLGDPKCHRLSIRWAWSRTAEPDASALAGKPVLAQLVAAIAAALGSSNALFHEPRDNW